MNYPADFYPSPAEVDQWCKELLARTEKISIQGELLDLSPLKEPFGNCPNTLVNRYVRFTAGDGRRTFYGYWQPALKTPAPLLINLPGYGGFMSLHPQLCDQNFHVLHISPLGFVTPEGARRELALPDGNWPVLPNTALGRPDNYEDWLSDCLLAIRWALGQPGTENRLSLFGTSQGGGGSLLLASLLGPDRVRCVCADLPFLTGFPSTGLRGEAYGLLKPVEDQVPPELFWRRLGFVDTLSHAHRLAMPVMLSGGGADGTCPASTVELLFARLPGTKQYTYLEEQIHTHSRSSMVLFGAWLHLYA
ncbi:MAG: acetylxylan esterase [Oscillospiraceae bacterium]|nr:acetylxylan esterase [Oscillospiraceae bacterium]